MPIYMRYEGIEGSVTNAQFRGWHEVFGYSWGETNTGTTAGGGGGAGRVDMSDFNVMKPSGQGSTKLFLKCAQGSHLPAVQLVVTAPRQGREVAVVEYKLTDVLISSYQVNGDGNSTQSESLSLNFTKIEYKVTHFDEAGRPVTESAFWDLGGNHGG